jgi:hypothetical protein
MAFHKIGSIICGFFLKQTRCIGVTNSLAIARQKHSEKPTGNTKETPFETFPNLHRRVRDALAKEPDAHVWKFNYDHDRTAGRIRNIKDTHIMGHFVCQNTACQNHGWGSNKIGICIREFSKYRYDALVFKQRCKSCNSIGLMRINKQSYVDRVTYRLKKWSGIEMEKREHLEDKVGPPHERELCEGCKAGHCMAAHEKKETKEDKPGAGRHKTYD